jgi:hypothetical protein
VTVEKEQRIADFIDDGDGGKGIAKVNSDDGLRGRDVYYGAAVWDLAVESHFLRVWVLCRGQGVVVTRQMPGNDDQIDEMSMRCDVI